ncbi:CoA pyrophosphatase [Corynebacterium uberis]|uniref:NUDIX hydrolase n=1 Tax=Corynebacterium sp. c6VSa_13 TaxID=2913496 RepID=UPI001D0B49B3|nr:CoA pyrophosphatase [Corynebacterium uberis]MCZ9309949.1 CoA pyrophosphatase [Corynebacterium sp. c6VSa_13]UDL73132.1 CoA pyrophosphatase [Corynebacterium uberis]UDL75991.1 CoA pyrophosphatase [Corynebacterium uberis]UDL78203.1 CoA pyrophosphatase [Corynebacterium uberis]UDL80486.1 CoA pyrophosphatase [Corynebacterium uberis]
MIPGPPADSPGANIYPRPDEAPQWLRTLIDAARAGTLTSTVTRQLGPAGRFAAARRRRQAAVLMALSGDPAATELPEDAGLLLTHRTPTMRAHAGQVAFPGGRIDAADVSAIDAALREAWEETGLDRHDVTPLAQLDRVAIRASGAPVHPVLAYRHRLGEVGVASPLENDDVFVAPLADLADPRQRLEVGLRGWSGPAFWVRDYLVWGFTGALIDGLLRAGGWERPWDAETVLDLRAALDRSRNNEAPGGGAMWDAH